MGTGFDISKSEELMGIIPRAVDQLFTEIEARWVKLDGRLYCEIFTNIVGVL